jgi:Flp pilus assembly protein TadB
VTRKEIDMPTWLILILVGVALVILGVATEIGQFLIWIGAIVLVASLIIGLVGRTRT